MKPLGKILKMFEKAVNELERFETESEALDKQLKDEIAQLNNRATSVRSDWQRAAHIRQNLNKLLAADSE